MALWNLKIFMYLGLVVAPWPGYIKLDKKDIYILSNKKMRKKLLTGQLDQVDGFRFAKVMPLLQTAFFNGLSKTRLSRRSQARWQGSEVQSKGSYNFYNQSNYLAYVAIIQLIVLPLTSRVPEEYVITESIGLNTPSSNRPNLLLVNTTWVWL